MHLFNIFKAFSPNSPSQDVQSAGEGVPVPPSPGAIRKRRRLKRRNTKPVATPWQAEETRSLSGIRVPDSTHEGFRSAPNLLTQHEMQDGSRYPTLERTYAATSPRNRLQEQFERSSHDYPQTADPKHTSQWSENLETPLFAQRHEELFREEVQTEMESPLAQLAYGWPEPRRNAPRKLPDPPVGHPNRSEIPRDTTSTHSKEFAPQRRNSPQPTYPRISTESSRRDSGSRRSSETVSPHSKELPTEWRHSPHRSATPESSLHRDRSPHSSRAVDGTYYIVPGGVNVVFQDGEGKEITRVGDFSGRRRRVSPIIVEDDHGRELYRTSDIYPDSSSGYSGHSRSRSELPTIVLIDRTGRQIPIMPLMSERRSE
ncbi:hypothetical protein R3P38DRAFT_667968 [Favolaschia claudopus]|uniref:Uncharacterized protein n=1 Tax=Favolaschia claudopus TaxID=2862362 RepID=A0AAW0EB58_9AGAR